MNKLSYVIITLLTVIIVEAGVYFFVLGTANNKPPSPNTNTLTFSDKQMSVFANLLIFYLAMEERVFVDGEASVKLVGSATNVKNTKDKLELSLCKDPSIDSKCTPLVLNISELHYVNIEKVKEGSKVQIDMKFNFLNKKNSATITQL